jgi:hypothetical protein
MVHSSKDGNPLIDGRGAVRLMRWSIGRGSARREEAVLLVERRIIARRGTEFIVSKKKS